MISFLKPLAKLVVAFSDICPTDKAFMKKMLSIALNGSPEEAKNAAKLISIGNSNEEAVKLINEIVPRLNLDNKLLVTHLMCLKMLAKYKSHLIQKRPIILDFIVNSLLLKNNDADSHESNWVQFEDLPLIGQSKVVGLHILAHLLLVPSAGVETLADSILKLLRTALSNDGELSGPESTW